MTDSLVVVRDPSLCTGHARCNAAAPDLFPIDDDGYCAVARVDVPAEAVGRARDAVAACPEVALRFVG